MTLFGKFLLFILFVLFGGALVVVVRNYEVPSPPYSEILDPSAGEVENVSTTTPPEPVAVVPVPEQLPVSVSVPTSPIHTSPLPDLETSQFITPPDWDAINTHTRSALANILCTAKHGDQFRPLSGSGVFIDERGLILTNAHVAQYLLLTEGGEKSNLLDCVIRVGNPAETRYYANILFISPTWIAEHAESLLQENPTERGDRDYALLLVTETTNPAASLPDSFPSLTLRTDTLPERKDAYLVAGYPAGFLGGIAVQLQLWSVSSFATVETRYTFTENTLDLVGLGGNLLAQKGSSGGALVDGEGTLAGLIVTATIEGATGERDVRALTIDYIRRVFEEEAGFSFTALADADLSSLAAQFARDIAPSLRQRLVEVLK